MQSHHIKSEQQQKIAVNCRKDKIKNAPKVHKDKIDSVAGSGSSKNISINDTDHLSMSQIKLMVQPSSIERHNRSSKDGSGSRACRCDAGAPNKISGRSSVEKSTTFTATGTNTIELLQNPKVLPIRVFEKLSPVVSKTTANSTCNSLSSVDSSLVDATNIEKANTAITAATTTSTTTVSNKTNLVVRNLNHQIDKLLKNESLATGKAVETIYLNVVSKKNLEKLLQSNGNGESMTESKSSSTEKESDNSLGGSDSSTKRITADDTLILRICDLEYATHRSSLSPTTATTQNGRSSSASNKTKTKLRTKTDPHPVSLSQKQRRFSSTTTSTIDLKNYKRCTSQVLAGQHNGSKCNCSSCHVMKASNTSSENKTKSVGTQHDAVAQCAFDPWVKQCSVVKNIERGQTTKSGNSISNAIAVNPLLNQKIANTNAKVIVITDDFKKKALNQEVLVDTKRRILRYMRANKLLSSSRSMDDVRIATSSTAGIDCNQMVDTENMNEHQMNTSVLSINKSTEGESKTDDLTASTNTVDVRKTKAISKSVDNISVLSTEMDALDNVGSVELIFISDEFLNKVSDQDVIVLKNNSKIPAGRKSVPGSFDGGSISKNVSRKQIVVITDEYCRKSIKDNKIVVSNKNEVVNKKTTKHLNRQSSAESSIDDVNNKITSRAFQSYDEEAEHLESKEIQ